MAALHTAAATNGDQPAAVQGGRRGVSTAVSGDERNPYKGLRAFDEADVDDFAGRARLVDQLVTALAEHRLIAVVGPSGSGKSSAVRAGLLPALRRDRVPGSSEWFVTTLVPGDNPFEELETALLRVAAQHPPDLLTVLESGPRGLARGIRQVVPEDGGQVLLVIDQFEELFTLTEPAAARRFLDTLATAVTEERPRLRVVLTLRADFYDRPLRHEATGRLVRDGTVAVLPLAADELERAIVDPAAAVGVEFEPGLVSEIVADVSDQPGALPLLQYALTELYEARLSGLMTRSAYNDLGGVAGALTRRAEQLYQSANADGRRALRRLFGRLVSLGEGTEDTRRRALRSELADDTATAKAVEAFGQARLLSFDRDPVSREPTVEVAHEALIKSWPRLRGWLDNDRDDLRVLRHLHTASHDWAAAGKPDSELYRGGRLEAAEDYLSRSDGALTPLEDEFVVTALSRREAEANADRRSRRRLRGLLVGVALVAAVAVIASVIAFQQRTVATDTAYDAETRRLVADAAALAGSNPDLAMLLAREAYNRDPGPLTLSGLQRVLMTTGPYLGVIGRGETFLAGGWLADGTIAALTEDEIRFYGGDSRQLLDAYELPAGVGILFDYEVAFDVGRERAVVGTNNGTIVIVGPDSTPALLRPTSAPTTAVALDDDRGLLAVGDLNGDTFLLDVASGEVLWRTSTIPEQEFADVMGQDELAQVPWLLQFNDTVFASGPRDIAFEPSGSVLVAGGVHIRRLDAASGDIVNEAVIWSQLTPNDPLTPRAPSSLTPDRDGGVMVAAGINAFAELDSDLIVRSTSFIPTGRSNLQIASRTFALDGAGAIWFGINNGQLAKGAVDTIDAEADRLVTGLGAIRQVAASPEGGRLLVIGQGGVEIWSTDGQQLMGRAVPRGQNNEVYVATDGSAVIASNLDLGGESLLYDLTEPIPERLPLPRTQGSTAYRFPPDPNAATIGAFITDRDLDEADGPVLQFYDRETLEKVGEQLGRSVRTIDDSGTLLVEGHFPLGVTFHAYPSGEQLGGYHDLTAFAGPNDQFVNSVDLDARSERLLVSFPSGVTMLFGVVDYDLEFLASIEPGPDQSGAVTARFLPDGQSIVTRSRDGVITVRDLATLAAVRDYPAGSGATETLSVGPYISPDGEYLITVREQRPRMIHLPTGTEIGTFPNTVGVVPSGADVGADLHLVTAVGEHAVVWNLDVGSWSEIACRAVGRNLTRAEWDQFGPADTDLRVTCPQWPTAS